ncbi:ribosomal-protein-alanine acetyltransferase [Actinokineospora fastidiosa]|uniref:Ribosomal-protein-alanine acetyltransferase n=1 Tax=Actinokineospora fastidiosa TaxID=1816 RepID=A0A918L9R8_9PSEU|nr:ribosomal-protein-alanine acetyltransferase [Actinokineospora fastidiosa]
MRTAQVRTAHLRREDLARCAELERVLFAGEDPWSEAAFASELDWGHYYLGAYAADRLVGYAGLAVVGPPGDVEASVHTLGVDPDWQRRGIGRLLLRELLAEADRVGATVFLEVRTDNEPAIALYAAHGFTRVGLRKRYYQPSGADAYTMMRPAPVEETT